MQNTERDLFRNSLLKELKKDCSTCEFNFGELQGCSNEYFGEKIEDLLKVVTNCRGWEISFEEFCKIEDEVNKKFGYIPD